MDAQVEHLERALTPQDGAHINLQITNGFRP